MNHKELGVHNIKGVKQQTATPTPLTSCPPSKRVVPNTQCKATNNGTSNSTLHNKNVITIPNKMV